MRKIIFKNIKPIYFIIIFVFTIACKEEIKVKLHVDNS